MINKETIKEFLKQDQRKILIFIFVFLVLAFIYYFEELVPNQVKQYAEIFYFTFFMAGICWIGLPFTYVVRKIWIMTGKKFESILSKKARYAAKVGNYMSRWLDEVLFFYLVPFFFGAIIFFVALKDIYLFISPFILITAGLLYLYFSTTKIMRNILHLGLLTSMERKEIRKGFSVLTKKDFYIGGMILIIMGLLYFSFTERYTSFIPVLLGISSVLYGFRVKK